jgi:DNA-binding MarR family transcriptional regulator
MTVGKPSTEEVVIGALASRPDATVADVATATGLGRSTVGKALARLERAGKARRHRAGRDGRQRRPDRWSPTTEETRTGARRQRASERLRSGQLDGLVLDHVKRHKESGPHGPTALAKALGRSSGAVGNCLARLDAAGRVREVGGRPRRYVA